MGSPAPANPPSERPDKTRRQQTPSLGGAIFGQGISPTDSGRGSGGADNSGGGGFACAEMWGPWRT